MNIVRRFEEAIRTKKPKSLRIAILERKIVYLRRDLRLYEKVSPLNQADVDEVVFIYRQIRANERRIAVTERSTSLNNLR